MIQGTRYYLRDIVPEDSYVGIVQFNETGTINSHLVHVRNSTSRELLVSHLPTSPNGAGTCIGCGILKGINVSELNTMHDRLISYAKNCMFLTIVG